MPPPSYSNESFWKQYQAFFPAYARVNDENVPAETWFAWRGHAIHLDHYASDAAALTVILVHGGGGYGRMLAPLALLLQRAGHDVIVPDLPGYGLSKAPAALVSYEAWVDLLCALVTRQRNMSPRPVVLCGGSLGGHLAYLVAARMEKGAVAGLIATTLADPRTLLVRHQFARNALVRATMPALPIFSALLGRLRLPVKWFTKMHAMSNTPALSRLVATDPLGGGRRVPISFMQSIFAAQPRHEPEAFDHCPVLLAHPGDDRWTGIESSRAFFDRIKGPKRLVLLENCGHLPIEEPGFSTLEEEAGRFLASIAARHADHKASVT